MNGQELRKDAFIIDFFDKTEAAQNTRKLYIQALQHYTGVACKSPKELIEEAEAEIKEGKLMRERSLNKYLTSFKKLIEEKDFAPITRNVFITGVTSFYRAYDIPLPNHFKTRKAQPLKENAINGFIKKETIIKMIHSAASLRDKAIILTMASSGMAMNEARNLRVKDIKNVDEHGIVTLFLSRQKVAGAVEPYYAFLSPEAGDAIKVYLEERNRSELARVKGDTDYLFVNYQDGGQVGERMFQYIFFQIGLKLGYIKDGRQPYEVNPLSSHKLRKFYSNILKNEDVVDDGFIDYTMGHTTPAVQRAYHQPDLEKLKNKYIRCLPYLTFLRQVTPLVVESEGYAKLREENEALQLQLQEQGAKIKKIEKAAKEIEERSKSIPSMLATLQEDPAFVKLLMKHLQRPEH